MGYSTDFSGVLKFTPDSPIAALPLVSQMLGQDLRDHPEWGGRGLTSIDLQMAEDMSGLEWDGSEKTYDLTAKVNVILDFVQKTYPSFGLEGTLTAQGEDPDDRWLLAIVDGRAIKRELQVLTVEEGEVCCPNCQHKFNLIK